ncbi:MAG: hypothetical protein SFX73_15805 [Kofleriaceae bacterium]|nr:hypothetical protein [Kofleriaceae bacterium]
MLRFVWVALLLGCGHSARPVHPARALAPAACAKAPPRALDVELSTKPVAKVTITGPAAWTQEVRQRVETKAGSDLDRTLLAADVRRLWELGIASQIEARIADTSAGPEVELVMHPPLRIARVVGAEHPLLALLRPLEGSLYDPARLQTLARLAERRLKAHGYARATVRPTAEVRCGLVSVTYAVKTGPQYRLSALVVEGSALPIGRSFERALGTANVVGGVLNYEDILSETQFLVTQHQLQGWVTASAKEPVLAYDDARGLVAVRIEIKAGPRYRFGTLVVVGGSERARARFEELVRPLRGALLDMNAYREVEKRLGDDMHALGFGVWTTPVTKDQTLDVQFELRPEPR